MGLTKTDYDEVKSFIFDGFEQNEIYPEHKENLYKFSDVAVMDRSITGK